MGGEGCGKFSRTCTGIPLTDLQRQPLQQPLQNLFPIVNKHLRDLIAVRLLIGAGMHRPVVESQDLGAGDT